MTNDLEEEYDDLVDEYFDDAYEDVDDEDNSVERNPSEGRTSWMYLGLLCVVFVALVGSSFLFKDTPETSEEIAEAASINPVAAPVDLRITVAGDIVTLFGAVPDDAARAQLTRLAGDAYGNENLVDEITVDSEVSFDGGFVTLVGEAQKGDVRPEALQQSIASDFGMTAGSNEVNRSEVLLKAVDVEVQVADGNVRMFGVVPDQTSIDDLVQAAGSVWTEATVDGSGLSVGEETVWEDGTVRVTGSIVPGDARADEFPDVIKDAFGALVTTDLSGLALDTSDGALAVVEGDIAEQLTSQRIEFVGATAEIAEASDSSLTQLAALLNATYPDLSFIIIGHTDDVGNDEANLILSQDRAKAVRERLISLGVQENRLTTDGKGEEEPLVPIDEDGAQDLNRRIEVRVSTS